MLFMLNDEERNEKHDADGVDTQLRHLLDVLLQEHTHALGTRKRAPHQHDVATEGGQPFRYLHALVLIFAAKVRKNGHGLLRLTQINNKFLKK